MSILLAIETSTEALSVGLRFAETTLVEHRMAPREHARLLLPTIAALLAKAGLARSAIDAIAVGRGPGAFTGVRIGMAAAHGLGLGLNRPLIPISTLAVLAQSQALAGRRILSAIDARMQELYVGEFLTGADGLVGEAQAEACLAASAWLPVFDDATVCVGSGFLAHPELLRGLNRFANALPHAGDLLILGKRDFDLGLAVSPEFAQPVYLRNDVAKKKAST